MISFKDFVQAGRQLLTKAAAEKIPYVNNGSTINGMDCQGLVEYLLRECGTSVNYLGSNDMWRNLGKWSGTVEEAVKLFGSIPSGALLYIWKQDGAPSRYKDDKGNATHVGVYLDSNEAVHASASRGCVAPSTIKNKSINGGWNKVMLCKFILYDNSVESKLTVSGAEEGVKMEMGYITSADGGWVNVRKSPNTTSDRLAKANCGDQVEILEAGDQWSKISYNGITGYVMSKFISKSPASSAATNKNVKTSLQEIANALNKIIQSM